LCGYLQTGQQLHLLTAMIEWCLLAHQRLHAPHAGRETGIGYIEFGVGRELAFMAVRAQVVGARNRSWTERSENRPGALVPITGPLAAVANDAALHTGGFRELQQLTQGAGSGLMQSCAESYLDGLQVEASCFAPLAEDDTQYLLYFARDFLLNRIRRFFSCGLIVSSTGRARQICSLISSNC
ncbi:MAG: hypothetical protein H7Y20_05210, partial [Bryobacteraceae bacterium]|nr:hypothetical protein [Bryobacteraceae bacterium]